MMEEFRDIIETSKLKILYQPIVDLRRAKPLGWEALSRGPANSIFEKPATLFDFAEEVNYLFSLERVCREQAIAQLGKISKEQKLFLNIHPHTVADPNFAAGQTMQIIEAQGLKPDNVVFEITERHPLKDFTFFFKTMEHYRAQGYLMAIDDVGAGYSGLWTIANVRPDFIKRDMSLVRNVDSNPIQRALIDTLLTLADKIGCKVIAEGIETETELTTLMDMGVPYGQGFYLARPENPKQYDSAQLSLPPSYYSETRTKIACSIPIQQLVSVPPSVSPDTPVTQVHEMLKSLRDSPISSIVVANNGRPIGLVMSHHLHRILGNRFGVALYYERSVTAVMDSEPLIFDEKTPVEIAAEMAVNREKHKVYDHVIVTKNGKLTGNDEYPGPRASGDG